MTTSNNVYHVFASRKGGWVIRRREKSRTLHKFDTKQEAVDFGRKISRKEESELVIHRKDGSIQGVDRYGPISSKPIPKYLSTDKTDINDIKKAVTAVYIVPKQSDWVVTKGGHEISPSSDSISGAITYAWDVRRERGTDVIVIDKEGNVIRSSDFDEFDKFVEESNKIDR